MPRRPSPRPASRPAAWPLAGTFTGIYPRTSPAGWQIIGHTDATLWDPGRDPPALLAPGTIGALPARVTTVRTVPEGTALT